MPRAQLRFLQGKFDSRHLGDLSHFRGFMAHNNYDFLKAPRTDCIHNIGNHRAARHMVQDLGHPGFHARPFTSGQYQSWKVVHGYGVFLSFVNFFFGLCIDRLNLTRGQKEISSWSFLLAGFVGGIARMLLVLFSALGEFGLYASLSETVLFVLGTFILVRGQMKEQPDRPERSAGPRYLRAR